MSGFCSSAEIDSRLEVPVWRLRFGDSRLGVLVWKFPFRCSRLEILVWRFPFRGSRLEVPVWRLPFRVPVREHRFCELLETVKGMQQCKSQYYVHESNDFVDLAGTYGNDFVDFGDMYHVLATILLISMTCLAFWPWSPRGIGGRMHGEG